MICIVYYVAAYLSFTYRVNLCLQSLECWAFIQRYRLILEHFWYLNPFWNQHLQVDCLKLFLKPLVVTLSWICCLSVWKRKMTTYYLYPIIKGKPEFHTEKIFCFKRLDYYNYFLRNEAAQYFITFSELRGKFNKSWMAIRYLS